MDPEWKRTLALIESILYTLDDNERGRQVLMLMKDYIDDGDLKRAHSLIFAVPKDYIESQLVVDCACDRRIAAALAAVIEALGWDWFKARGALGRG